MFPVILLDRPPATKQTRSFVTFAINRSHRSNRFPNVYKIILLSANSLRALAACEFFRFAIGGRKHGEGETVEFFARYLLPSMGNWATGRADMSSRHHARQSTRVIHCISELSEAPFFRFSLLKLKQWKSKIKSWRHIAISFSHVY